MSTIKRICDSNASGTHLIGTFRATYNELVETLGDPYRCDGYKVTVEWVLEYGGNVFTLYDWKEDLLPKDNPDRSFLFHIGGTADSKCYVDIFCYFLNRYLVEKVIIEGES